MDRHNESPSAHEVPSSAWDDGAVRHRQPSSAGDALRVDQVGGADGADGAGRANQARGADGAGRDGRDSDADARREADDDTDTAEPWTRDPVVLLGAAIVALALAGIAALIADRLLRGDLQILASILAGVAAVCAALVPLRHRHLRIKAVAAVLGLAVTAMLVVPGWVSTRPERLADVAAVRLAPLGDGDRVVAPPVPSGPVLIRRADGTAQLVLGTTVHEVEASAGEVLALDHTGTHLARIADGATELLALRSSSPSRIAQLPGTPVSLGDGVLVMRDCSDGICRMSGYDLAAVGGSEPDEEAPLWAVTVPDEERGPDPAGVMLDPAAPPAGALDAIRATGLLAPIPVRYDDAQGWIQVDPHTGFPVGQVISAASEPCRVAVTTDRTGAEPLVMTVCAEHDGALVAAALRHGEELWRSEASPTGTWRVTMDSARVIARGTETGTDTEGEIVASEAQDAWWAPGGVLLESADPIRARIGMNGSIMLVENAHGQVVAYDTATGENPWTLPAAESTGSAEHGQQPAVARGALGSRGAAVIDGAPRTRPLEPRNARRIRLVDADGHISGQWIVADQVTAVPAADAFGAVLSTDEASWLLRPAEPSPSS